jgi:hypothetical protein
VRSPQRAIAGAAEAEGVHQGRERVYAPGTRLGQQRNVHIQVDLAGAQHSSVENIIDQG